MVRADFYDGPKSSDDSNFQGSVSMDLPRITNKFMQNVLYGMRMVDPDEDIWCYLYVDDEYVGIINYYGLFERYSFINRGSDHVYVQDRRRWVRYDRQAG